MYNDVSNCLHCHSNKWKLREGQSNKILTWCPVRNTFIMWNRANGSSCSSVLRLRSCLLLMTDGDMMVNEERWNAESASRLCSDSRLWWEILNKSRISSSNCAGVALQSLSGFPPSSSSFFNTFSAGNISTSYDDVMPLWKSGRTPLIQSNHRQAQPMLKA